MDWLECQPNLDPNLSGILISGVIKDSPADQAGLVPGDLITHFAGKKVSARIPEDIPLFNQISYGIGIGKKVQIKGVREGKEKMGPYNRFEGISIFQGKGIEKLGAHDSKFHFNVFLGSTA